MKFSFTMNLKLSRNFQQPAISSVKKEELHENITRDRCRNISHNFYSTWILCLLSKDIAQCLKDVTVEHECPAESVRSSLCDNFLQWPKLKSVESVGEIRKVVYGYLITCHCHQVIMFSAVFLSEMVIQRGFRFGSWCGGNAWLERQSS